MSSCQNLICFAFMVAAAPPGKYPSKAAVGRNNKAEFGETL